jgi:hypothetical protein
MDVKLPKTMDLFMLGITIFSPHLWNKNRFVKIRLASSSQFIQPIFTYFIFKLAFHQT